MRLTMITATLAIGAAAASAPAALAQSAQADPERAVEHCRAMSTTALQIACLENALMARAAAPAPSGSGQTGHHPASPLSPPSPSRPAPAMAAPTGLGAEQVRARRESRDASGVSERVDAILIDHARTAGGNLVLVLDNGQAWKQSGGDRTRVRLEPGRSYAVTIAPGTLSGYRLRIEELRQILTVERVR